MSLEELQAKRQRLKANTDITLDNMEKLTNESYRVADVAHNSRQILDDLDRKFAEQTGLKGKDIAFLFLATGLQLARWIIINKLTHVEQAGNVNHNEDELHKFQDWLLKRFDNGQLINERPYYASLNHIISRHGVPYDATSYLTKESIEKLLKKDSTWRFGLDDLITDKLPLFKGANHRFSTLGHDPVLGLLFGTGNIMTNTITCVKKPIIAGGVGIPILTTNHVIYTSEFKDPRIGTYASTAAMLGQAIKRTKDEPEAFVASLIKQIIHIGTDLYTPCGIQIPAANLLLSNYNVEKITKYISTGDIIKIGTSAKLAELINTLISTLHLLMYNPDEFPSQDVYSVKTRKIIMYSNLISSTSNVIWVGGNMIAGNESAVKDLDIGGLIVTIHRLLTDTEYIRQVKEEFVFGGFNRMIQGNDLDLKEVDLWG